MPALESVRCSQLVSLKCFFPPLLHTPAQPCFFWGFALNLCHLPALRPRPSRPGGRLSQQRRSRRGRSGDRAAQRGGRGVHQRSAPPLARLHLDSSRSTLPGLASAIRNPGGPRRPLQVDPRRSVSHLIESSPAQAAAGGGRRSAVTLSCAWCKLRGPNIGGHLVQIGTGEPCLWPRFSVAFIAMVVRPNIVAVMCKSGVHRSVVLSMLLHDWLRRGRPMAGVVLCCR